MSDEGWVGGQGHTQTHISHISHNTGNTESFLTTGFIRERWNRGRLTNDCFPFFTPGFNYGVCLPVRRGRACPEMLCYILTGYCAAVEKHRCFRLFIRIHTNPQVGLFSTFTSVLRTHPAAIYKRSQTQSYTRTALKRYPQSIKIHDSIKTALEPVLNGSA